MNPIRTLNSHGQSIWLDFIRRKLLDNGELQRMIDDGISGLTSNPAIFQKAIAGSDDYNDAIAALAADRSLDTEAVYERLAMDDIRRTADLLRPVYEASEGRDGYVSMEVSPRLARDTAGTIDAATRIWAGIDRPNLMIKVPATPEGLPALTTLIAAGINVNVTLLFAIDVYAETAEHYLRGLEQRLEAGRPIDRCASVASFFLSRIDTSVDKALDGVDGAAAHQGKAAVASAKLAYQRWKAIYQGPRWERLRAAGARPQRLLWASTSTKNPNYDELLYVSTLVGPDTVNTLPPNTLDALGDHGQAQASVEDGLDQARQSLDALPGLGVDLKAVTDDLLVDGLAKFDDAYSKLLDALEQARGDVPTS